MHLEQDAGKSIHDRSPLFSYIDLNRAGVGLMEIVNMPDIRSPEEAGAYLRKLRAIVRAFYVIFCRIPLLHKEKKASVIKVHHAFSFGKDTDRSYPQNHTFSYFAFYLDSLKRIKSLHICSLKHTGKSEEKSLPHFPVLFNRLFTPFFTADKPTYPKYPHTEIK